MALIVEDGSGVDDADSYVSLEDAIAFAAKRGVTLPGGDAGNVLLVKAMDYLETLEGSFKGERSDPDQALAWPRQNVVINGKQLDDDEIPKQLIDLQCQLAMDAMSGELTPNGSGRVVKRQKIDVIETEYEQTTGAPELNKADRLLAFLVDEGSFGFTAPILRV